MFTLHARRVGRHLHTFTKGRRGRRLWVQALEDRTVPAQFHVYNNSDLVSDAGSLRWALNQAQTTAGDDEIVFDLTNLGNGVVTSPILVPTSELLYTASDGGALKI